MRGDGRTRRNKVWGRPPPPPAAAEGLQQQLLTGRLEHEGGKDGPQASAAARYLNRLLLVWNYVTPNVGPPQV